MEEFRTKATLQCAVKGVWAGAAACRCVPLPTARACCPQHAHAPAVNRRTRGHRRPPRCCEVLRAAAAPEVDGCLAAPMDAWHSAGALLGQAPARWTGCSCRRWWRRRSCAWRPPRAQAAAAAPASAGCPRRLAVRQRARCASVRSCMCQAQRGHPLAVIGRYDRLFCLPCRDKACCCWVRWVRAARLAQATCAEPTRPAQPTSWRSIPAAASTSASLSLSTRAAAQPRRPRRRRPPRRRRAARTLGRACSTTRGPCCRRPRPLDPNTQGQPPRARRRRRRTRPLLCRAAAAAQASRVPLAQGRHNQLARRTQARSEAPQGRWARRPR